MYRFRNFVSCILPRTMAHFVAWCYERCAMKTVAIVPPRASGPCERVPAPLTNAGPEADTRPATGGPGFAAADETASYTVGPPAVTQWVGSRERPFISAPDAGALLN